MSDVDHLFQRLCHEAVLACGSDLPAVERYVLDRIDRMDAADRDRIKRDLARVLGFREPDHPFQMH